MKNEPEYKLVNLSPEEGKRITEELDTIFNKYSAQLTVTAIINPNGTLGAKAEIFKKVELVLKTDSASEGIKSPFVKNGENNKTDETEKTD